MPEQADVRMVAEVIRDCRRFGNAPEGISPGLRHRLLLEAADLIEQRIVAPGRDRIVAVGELTEGECVAYARSVHDADRIPRILYQGQHPVLDADADGVVALRDGVRDMKRELGWSVNEVFNDFAVTLSSDAAHGRGVPVQEVTQDGA
jgi:hypothetical protein